MVRDCSTSSAPTLSNKLHFCISAFLAASRQLHLSIWVSAFSHAALTQLHSGPATPLNSSVFSIQGTQASKHPASNVQTPCSNPQNHHKASGASNQHLPSSQTSTHSQTPTFSTLTPLQATPRPPLPSTHTTCDMLLSCPCNPARCLGPHYGTDPPARAA
ncbi:hypothetical protein FPQ18DRAFT_313560 [Pyronema domesticum]|nr:hypothetical protein FPQ18DRAFT_313560 [Pyronema domesticum]